MHIRRRPKHTGRRRLDMHARCTLQLFVARTRRFFSDHNARSYFLGRPPVVLPPPHTRRLALALSGSTQRCGDCGNVRRSDSQAPAAARVLAANGSVTQGKRIETSALTSFPGSLTQTSARQDPERCSSTETSVLARCHSFQGLPLCGQRLRPRFSPSACHSHSADLA